MEQQLFEQRFVATSNHFEAVIELTLVLAEVL
jgi:hypothetical protein